MIGTYRIFLQQHNLRVSSVSQREWSAIEKMLEMKVEDRVLRGNGGGGGVGTLNHNCRYCRGEDRRLSSKNKKMSAIRRPQASEVKRKHQSKTSRSCTIL